MKGKERERKNGRRRRRIQKVREIESTKQMKQQTSTYTALHCVHIRQCSEKNSSPKNTSLHIIVVLLNSKLISTFLVFLGAYYLFIYLFIFLPFSFFLLYYYYYYCFYYSMCIRYRVNFEDYYYYYDYYYKEKE